MDRSRGWIRSADWALGETERRRIAFAIAIGLNIGFLVALDRLMPVRPAALHESHARGMELRLIQPVRIVELVPSPVAPPTAEPARIRRSAAAARSTPSVAPVAPAPAIPPSTLDLFTRDGRVRLPTETASSPRADRGFPDTQLKPDERNPFEHRDLLPYLRGRFENAWAAPANESLGAKAMRKFYSHRWTTPWGAPIACEQGTPTVETPIVIECRSGASSATSDELRAMRVDPPTPRKSGSQ